MASNNKTIMLDPGHGWNDKLRRYSRPITTIKNEKAIVLPNSIRRHEKDNTPNYYREDIGVLEIARWTKDTLEEFGYTVHMTRSLDNDLNAAHHLADELNGNTWKRENWKAWKWIKEATKAYNCDALISIHTNAGGGTGTCAFYADSPGKILGKQICQEISDEFNLKIRRIAKRKFAILTGSCKGNACLVECAFHDHYNDLKLLLIPDNLKIFGKVIACGIDNFFKLPK